MLYRAVFLDRDGVINEDSSEYVKSWSEFRFLPGALEGLRDLASQRCKIVVVTNQSAIGRRIASIEKIEEIHQNMKRRVKASGGRIDAIYYCPHLPADGCACRKPAPGMILRAAKELSIDLASSYMVGDKQSDIEAGRRAGCKTVLFASQGFPDLNLAAADCNCLSWAELVRLIEEKVGENGA